MSEPADRPSSEHVPPVPWEGDDGDGLSSGDLSSQTARQIDDLCDQFEQAWRANRSAPPAIEDFWPPALEYELSKSEVHLLLKELVILDLKYRQRSGLSDTLNPEHYFVRFPGCRAIIAEAFHIAGFDVSASFVSSSHEDTSRIPMETSSGFNLVSSPGMPSDADSPHLKSTIDELSRQLGDYEIQEELGHGGMGVVYRAFDPVMHRTVAIKVLTEDRTDSQEAVERFRREIRLLANLNHENIVRAFHAKVDPETNTHYLVMEHVAGVDLDALVQRLGRLSIPDACELVRQAAVGLQHAHENRLIHRDIKPSNLMLTSRGQVKVLDLGLARLRSANETSDLERLTNPGQVMGTVHFMAPEQAAETRAVDIRADIYSLGCTLYKFLTGQTPFGNEEGATPWMIMMQHVKEEFPRVTKLRPETPARLAGVLANMVAKSPDDRPGTPAKVAALLKPFCRGSNLPALFEAYETGTLPPPTPPAPPRRWLRRSAVGVVMIALLGLVAGLLLPRSGGTENGTDLLTAIDVNRDAVRGEWQKTAGLLKSPAKYPGACLRLPETLPAEFRLEVTADRKDGVNLMFAHRSRETSFALQLSLKPGTRAETTAAAPDTGPVFLKPWDIENLADPKPQTFVFTVRKHKLLIERDGKPLAERSNYPPLPEELAGVPNRLGFFIVTDNSEYEFSQIRLFPLAAEE